MNNYLCIDQCKKLGDIVYENVTLEIEKFSDSIEIEMSDIDSDLHIRLDIEQARQVAEFFAGFMGMVST